LPYSRFLVDAGATFEEHAVGRVDRRLTEAEIGFVRVALSAARPTVVSVLQPDEGALGVDPGNRSSAWAAAAVDAAQEIDGMSSGNAVGVTLSDGRSERRFSVARQGKFFAVREVK
jgi:hypothetical protein